MPVMAQQYQNLDLVYKYKKFQFNQKIETNPNCRWCPHCSQSRSQSQVDQRHHQDAGDGLQILSNDCQNIANEAIKLRKELMDLAEQIICNKGYELKLDKMAKRDRSQSNTSFDSIQFHNQIKKKANSCFNR